MRAGRLGHRAAMPLVLLLASLVMSGCLGHCPLAGCYHYMGVSYEGRFEDLWNQTQAGEALLAMGFSLTLIESTRMSGLRSSDGIGVRAGASDSIDGAKAPGNSTALFSYDGERRTFKTMDKAREHAREVADERRLADALDEFGTRTRWAQMGPPLLVPRIAVN